MSKFAAIFAAVVMFITLGACVNGQASGSNTSDSTAEVQSL